MNECDAFGFRALGLGEVAIGVGINTGMGCVGNMGSKSRFDYSVIGDAVNIAARLSRQQKKQVGPCWYPAKQHITVRDFALLQAGEIALKGKSRPAPLYALVGDEKLAATPQWQELAAAHQELLSTLEKGLPEEIDTCLGRCLAIAPSEMAEFYAKRVESMASAA